MAKNEYKGTVSIHGKEYPVEVIKGEAFIDGKTADQFLAEALIDVVRDFAKLGFGAVRGKRKDLQAEMDLMYIDGGSTTVLDADEID